MAVKSFWKSLTILASMVTFTIANPILTPGVWKNITPPGAGNASFSGVAIDPSNPSTLYTGFNFKGIWKSTDGGSNWIELGTSDPNIYDRQTPYLDDVSSIYVDPGNPNHLYVSKGVDGNNIGFWVSTDGGYNWVKPQGFPPTGTPDDVTGMAVDPTNFQHILLGTHACCEGIVMESKDGGSTWNSFKPGIGSGSFGISFLYHPSMGMGNANTWLAISGDFRRTIDAGASWNIASNSAGVHGSVETYYTSKGVLYAGGYQHLNRSTDNGVTWQSITDGVPGTVYYTICGDGTNLYACPEGGNTNYITSPESDGLHWTPYKGGTQKFTRSVLALRFDPANRIMYGGHWDEGLWALKVDGATEAKSVQNVRGKKMRSAQRAASDVFTINGKLLGRATVMNRTDAVVGRRKTDQQAVMVKAR